LQLIVLELKDPRTVFDLVALVELGIIGGAFEPHFVDDFEPTLSQAPDGSGMGLVFGAVGLVVGPGPGTAHQTMFAKKMDGVAQELVTSPALMALAMFARDFGDRRRAG
jgi:hypothetical protein